MVYPFTIKIEDLVSENHDLQSELNAFNNLKSDNKTAVINAAKMLHNEIKTHPPAMSWPPKEHELDPSKLSKYIPDLLDKFCGVLITGKSSDNGLNISERTVRLKNSIAQDMVYSVSNGNINTPKSVLFPAVVKLLCNNTEVGRLIKHYGHGISYSLIEETETEHALQIISEQKEKLVIIPDNMKSDDGDSSVALMVADNIDNLECTLSGAGASHRVNSILVKKQTPNRKSSMKNYSSQQREYVTGMYVTLPPEAVNNEIPEYYSGKRVGPGELKELERFKDSTK